MINLVITGAVRCDTVFFVNFPLHFRRNIAHLFGIANYAEILRRDIERIAGGIWKNWRRLLGDNNLREKQQKSEGTNAHRRIFYDRCHVAPKFTDFILLTLFFGRPPLHARHSANMRLSTEGSFPIRRLCEF
jgi:hypothetical protein